MAGGPTVLLSVTLVRNEEKQLLAALRDRGATVTLAKQADLAGVLSGTAPGPDLALVRNLSHAEAAEVTRRLAAAGVPTLNSPAAVQVCGDKGEQALLFARSGIPHPRSHLAYDTGQVAALATGLGRAVVKPVSASWGRGLARITDAATLECWTAGRESVDAAGRHFPVLVQEYVDKPGYDLRVVVVGTEPVAAIRRVSADWRTNTHLGATVEATRLDGPLRRLVGRVVHELGPGFYGVDVVVEAGTGRRLVLEVNANPEFARSAPVHGVDIAGLLAAHVLQRCAAAGRDTAAGHGAAAGRGAAATLPRAA
jgi:[lysine-biosynthesis-protein LysW]---L-2-aminoadipate ligase